MTDASINEYIGLFLQIPLVGIFVWFSLRLIKIFLDTLEQRDLQWQAYLAAQREIDRSAIGHMAGRFADEIKNLGKEISELKGSMR